MGSIALLADNWKCALSFASIRKGFLRHSLPAFNRRPFVAEFAEFAVALPALLLFTSISPRVPVLDQQFVIFASWTKFQITCARPTQRKTTPGSGAFRR